MGLIMNCPQRLRHASAVYKQGMAIAQRVYDKAVDIHPRDPELGSKVVAATQAWVEAARPLDEAWHKARIAYS